MKLVDVNALKAKFEADLAALGTEIESEATTAATTVATDVTNALAPAPASPVPSVPGSTVPGSAPKMPPFQRTAPTNLPPVNPLLQRGQRPSGAMGPSVPSASGVASGAASGAVSVPLFTVNKDAAGNLSLTLHHPDAVQDMTQAVAWLINKAGTLTGSVQLSLESVVSYLGRSASGFVNASKTPTATPLTNPVTAGTSTAGIPTTGSSGAVGSTGAASS